jgi:hypothetical protein
LITPVSTAQIMLTYQQIEFISTRLQKKIHTNIVKVKIVPVPTKLKQKTTRINAVITL